MTVTVLPMPGTPGATGGASLPPAQLAKMRKAAKEFEANAIGQLLEPMFNTVDLSKTPFGGGSAEATWRPTLVQEMAKAVSRGGGIGIAQPVLAQMIRMQELAGNPA